MHGRDCTSLLKVRIGDRTPATVCVAQRGDPSDRAELPDLAVLAEHDNVVPSRRDLLNRTDLLHLRQPLRCERADRRRQFANGHHPGRGLHFAPRDDFAGGRQGVEGPSSGDDDCW